MFVIIKRVNKRTAFSQRVNYLFTYHFMLSWRTKRVMFRWYLISLIPVNITIYNV